MSFQVGDAIALTKLAYQLYHDGVLVARAAPETFKDLLEELLLVKIILYRIDQSYVAYGRDYDESADLAMRRCKKALLSFQPLVKKYEKLGQTHRGSRLRQLQFPIDRGKIQSCRDDLKDCARYLNLVLTAEAAFKPVELPQAVAQESGSQHRRPSGIEPASPVPSSLTYNRPPRLLDGLQQVPLPFQRLNRIETLDTNAETEDGYLLPAARKVSTASNQQRISGEFSIHSADQSSQTSFAGSSPPIPHSEPAAPTSNQGAKPAITSGKPWYPPLSILRTSERPCEVDSVDHQEILAALSDNETFVELSPRFEESSKKLRDSPIDDLLARATWWLIKAQTIDGIVSNTPASARGVRQPAIDFLKCCYIVKNMVLTDSNTDVYVSDATWTSLQELATSICELLQSGVFQEVLPQTPINKQALSFAEVLYQPVEALSSLGEGLDNLDDPRRFVTVHEDDGGTPQERVLYRSFVDARIGPHDSRRRSSNAPYMVLLTSRQGRSELIVTLINQSGTINLCAPVSNEELQEGQSGLELDIHFPSQDAVLRFVSAAELDRFLDIPTTLLTAMSNRDARPDEFLIFREGLQSFNHRTPQAQPSTTANRDDMSSQAHSSCEISLYGAVPTDIWKTVRRLVISSPLDAHRPWCHSYWLPISNIQVSEGSRNVEISWSDCGNLNRWPDGEYGEYFSYVWSEKPNHTIALQFEDTVAATAFTSSILRPWVTPFEFDDSIKLEASFDSESDDTASSKTAQDRELSVWRLRNLNETEDQSYLSIVSTERRPYAGTMTSVYFLGESIDIAIEETLDHSLHFPALWGPSYLSNVIKTRRAPSVAPECADIVWAERDAIFRFSDALQMASFAKTIVAPWELKFSVRAPSMSMGHGLHTTRKNILLSLWENTDHTSPYDIRLRLAIRWMGELIPGKDFRWLTADVTNIQDCVSRPDKSRLTFRKVDVHKGDELEIQTLKAMDQRGTVTTKTREVTVILPDAGACQTA